jgi:hypothetical protein
MYLEAGPHKPAAVLGSENHLIVLLHKVRWAADAERTPIEDVGVEHGRSHVAIPQEFLNHSHVLVTFQNGNGITWPQASVAEPLGVTERTATGCFCHAGLGDSTLHGFLNNARIKMVAALSAGISVMPTLLLREHPLPGPFTI